MKIKLSKEQLHFVKEHSTIINSEGQRYAHIPSILRANPDGTITLLTYDELPDHVKYSLKESSPLWSKL